jgi:peptidoglycan hydrolase CwlO-like protein
LYKLLAELKKSKYLPSELNQLSSEINLLDNNTNQLSGEKNELDNKINQLFCEINQLDHKINQLSSEINQLVDSLFNSSLAVAGCCSLVGWLFPSLGKEGNYG